MTDQLPTFTIRAIGMVRNNVKGKPASGPARFDWSQVDSEIMIEPRLTESLDGIDDFSHIIVLFWADRVTETEVPIKVHPRRREDLPLVGTFASRSPNRANRILLSIVRLVERHGNVLLVKGLDALDGTPVIDIKPYIPRSDSFPNARVPDWIGRD